MWYYIFNNRDGEPRSLLSEASDLLPGALPPHVGYLERMTRVNWAVERWDDTIAAFVPRSDPTTTKLSRQDFMDRLGDDVVTLIQHASAAPTIQGASLRTWLLRYQIVSEIDVADPRTAAGVDALIAADLIPAARRDAILAPKALGGGA